MSQLRISIIGLYTPYPGGIAAHTTRLAEALSAHAEVHKEAFCNPFPKYLYPGSHAGDLRKSSELLAGTNYDLSYVFPGKWPTVLSRVIDSEPDAVILPWWTFVYAPYYRWLTVRLKKAGIPSIFMCHNLFDHESAKWKLMLSTYALNQADAYIFHSPEEAELAAEKLPAKPSLTHPHPVYDHLPPTSSRPEEARVDLLFFGFIRPYKGLEDLVSAVERLNQSTLHLTIAGDWWKGQKTLKIRCQRLKEKGTLTLIDRYVSDAEAAELFARCHAVILPYRRATNSGVLAHAIQARKPVIASKSGSLPLAVEEGKTGYLFPPGDVDELAKAIVKLTADIQSGRDFAPAIETIAARMSWEVFAAEVAGFIRNNF